MAVEIVMPKLGWTMEEGILVEWFKKDGEMVNAGDLLFSVEGDKALQEIEAFDNGILRIPPNSPPPGSKVTVGTLLAYLVAPGETFSSGQQGESKVAAARRDVTATAAPGTPPVMVEQTAATSESLMPNISPRARRIAEELGVSWMQLQGSGRTGRIVERDVRAATEQRHRTATAPAPAASNITPIARRVAQDLGVDVDALAAEFPGRRVTREDVERAALGTRPQPTPQTTTQKDTQVRARLSSVRRITAQRMSESAHTTAPVTLTTEADATELVRLREQLKADSSAGQQPIPTFTDLLVKISAFALREHPELNSRLEGEEVVTEAAVHIGIAVETERGLLVPVLRDVQDKSLRQLAAESESLVARTRGDKVSADELRGSTFTITNLGMYEIDAFTPIINLPDCAVLGVGRIVPKQIVTGKDERVMVRRMMVLSLTFDHRLVDGAPAARFLQRIKQLVEQPYLWLVT